MSLLITVIPVYNGERFLRATLESVAAQTRRPDRVIIQDNCSTDGTAAIAKEFEQEGFEWYLNESHLSSIHNFNAALRFSIEADVLHLLTADDLVTSDFYERLLEPLDGIDGIALAYAAYEVIDENGARVQGGDLVNPFPVDPKGKPRIIPHKRFIASQADLRTICLPAVLMKTNRSALPVEFSLDYIQCADAVFYAELAMHCEHIIEVPDALCLYRRHEDSATSRNKTRLAEVIADEWKAMCAASALLDKDGLSAWLWNFRQRCLLAATSRVMMQGVDKVTPALRMEVARATREITGGLTWALGNLAVALRDTFGQGQR